MAKKQVNSLASRSCTSIDEFAFNAAFLSQPLDFSAGTGFSYLITLESIAHDMLLSCVLRVFCGGKSHIRT